MPIVPAACVFDLAEHGNAAPGADEGYARRPAADRGDEVATGRVGAGRGATVGKWRGREHAVAGGVGVAVARCDDANVAVLAVVNAVGDVIGQRRANPAGLDRTAGYARFPFGAAFEEEGANTTLVVVVTDAAIDKLGVPSRGAERARRPGAGAATRRTPASTATSRSRSRPAWSRPTWIACE